MLKSNSFVRKTKKGKVLKVVRERYLRDDIGCGDIQCTKCDSTLAKLNGSSTQYLIIDTNIVLHQMDMLEHCSVNDVIVPSVVREEVKKRNLSLYNRLRTLCTCETRRFYVFSNEFHQETYVEQEQGESINDRNDRAIRVACRWYQRHLPDKQILLLTNDADNMKKAKQEGLQVQTALAFAAEQNISELLDLVVRPSDGDDDETGGGERPSKRRPPIYKDHKSLTELQLGMREGRYHQGTLRVNRYDPSRAAVSCESVGFDVYLKDHIDMNRGVDGDRVVLELYPEEQWVTEETRLPTEETDLVTEDENTGVAELAPDAGEEGYGIGAAGGTRRVTGYVVGIVKRAWRPYSGSLDLKSVRGGKAATVDVLFCAHNRSIPRVKIRTRQLETLKDQRIVVVIDSWSVFSRWPEGHYTKTLGKGGDKQTETEVLLVENDIKTQPFSEAVYACLPPLPWDLAAEEAKKPERADLRHILVCSVDPPGCTDIDDALHCTTDLCSLRSNVDRLAFSVLWEMTPEGDVLPEKTRYTKSVIRSSAALTYAEAQARIDDERLLDDISVSLRRMLMLTKKIRAKRMAAGALTLASPEVKFQVDTETHNPTDVGVYQIRETNQMVEEMMLLANCTVAAKILDSFPLWAVLRRHPTPSPQMFEPILRAAAAVDVQLDTSSSKALADTLDLAERPSDPYFNKMIRILTTRCMTQASALPEAPLLHCPLMQRCGGLASGTLEFSLSKAQYGCSGQMTTAEFHHYGLAAPLYTHFTSPIRRYADVLVHRFLEAAIGLTRLPPVLTDKDSVKELSDQLNYRHHNAQMAGRASTELHTLIFFKDRVVTSDARVIKVKENGMVVFVPKFGIEAMVYLNPKGVEEKAFELNMETQKITNAAEDLSYQIFDKVFVQISVAEVPPHGRKLMLKLVEESEVPVAGA
eukprot:gene2795-3587_t